MEPDDSDPLSECAPADVTEAPQSIADKSRQRYEFTYAQFMEWHKAKDMKWFSEDVLLAYFQELAEKMKPTSLWTQYSMLRFTLSHHHGVDITNYVKLKLLLKRKAHGYKPKKSKTFTSLEIKRFMDEAPNDKYLFSKVALAIGITGACRIQELSKLKVDDMEDLGSAVVIKLPESRGRRRPVFTMIGEFYNIYKQYALLRPSDVNERRFFLNYQNKKCTKQPVGINKFGNLPKQIASFLNLKNPELYTGHCFRRSSASSYL